MENEPQIIAEWQEPEHPGLQLPVPLTYVWIGAGALIILLILLGIFLHDSSFYLAAGVAVSALLSLIVQIRKPAPSLQVIITEQVVEIGHRRLLISDLAGFWLKKEDGLLAINLEPQKPAALPTTFLYGNQNEEEAREILLEILPELESRNETITDTVNRWFQKR